VGHSIACLQVSLAMSLLVCGNLSSVLPVLRETSGCNFASLDVRWELATRATLLALTALVFVSSFSIALTGSSFAIAAGDSEAATEPATDDALEAVGMLGFAMLGALPVPWTGGILIVVGLVTVYEEEDTRVEKKCQGV
jgi:hypothetical protein